MNLAAVIQLVIQINEFYIIFFFKTKLKLDLLIQKKLINSITVKVYFFHCFPLIPNWIGTIFKFGKDIINIFLSLSYIKYIIKYLFIFAKLLCLKALKNFLIKLLYLRRSLLRIIIVFMFC